MRRGRAAGGAVGFGSLHARICGAGPAAHRDPRGDRGPAGHAPGRALVSHYHREDTVLIGTTCFAHDGVMECENAILLETLTIWTGHALPSGLRPVAALILPLEGYT